MCGLDMSEVVVKSDTGVLLFLPAHNRRKNLERVRVGMEVKLLIPGSRPHRVPPFDDLRVFLALVKLPICDIVMQQKRNNGNVKSFRLGDFLLNEDLIKELPESYVKGKWVDKLLRQLDQVRAGGRIRDR